MSPSVQNATSQRIGSDKMSQNKCRFSVDKNVAFVLFEQAMKSQLKIVLKTLAWCFLIAVVILIGIWLCFLAYFSWPDAVDSVGERLDFP